MTKKINKIYNVSIFLGFLFFSLLLCVTAFQVLVSDDLKQITKAFFHGTAVLIDLLIWSYGGQRIMDCSLEVCDDCYKLDKDYKIIMIMTHRELKIESLKVETSLPTFTLVINRTMSLITLFKSFM